MKGVKQEGEEDERMSEPEGEGGVEMSFMDGEADVRTLASLQTDELHNHTIQSAEWRLE